MGKINEKLGLMENAHLNYLEALELDPKDSTKKIRGMIDLLNHKDTLNYTTIEKENCTTMKQRQ